MTNNRCLLCAKMIDEANDVGNYFVYFIVFNSRRLVAQVVNRAGQAPPRGNFRSARPIACARNTRTQESHGEGLPECRRCLPRRNAGECH